MNGQVGLSGNQQYMIESHIFNCSYFLHYFYGGQGFSSYFVVVAKTTIGANVITFI
ncbi:hypothetical protein D3C87_1968520 [compost metagenome]